MQLVKSSLLGFAVSSGLASMSPIMALAPHNFECSDPTIASVRVAIEHCTGLELAQQRNCSLEF